LQQECPNSDTHEVAWYTLAINAVRARIFNQTNCDCLYYPSLRTPTTRTAILSLIISLSYLLERQYYKQLIPAIAIGLVAISAMTFSRPLDWNLVSVAQVMSSRSPLWKLAVRGIQKRPFFGWTFNGFGIAYPFVAYPNKVPEIVNLG